MIRIGNRVNDRMGVSDALGQLTHSLHLLASHTYEVSDPRRLLKENVYEKAKKSIAECHKVVSIHDLVTA